MCTALIAVVLGGDYRLAKFVLSGGQPDITGVGILEYSRETDHQQFAGSVQEYEFYTPEEIETILSDAIKDLQDEDEETDPQQVLLILAPEIAPGLDPFLGSEVLNLVHSSRDFKTLNEIHRLPECDCVYLIDLDHDVLELHLKDRAGVLNISDRFEGFGIVTSLPLKDLPSPQDFLEHIEIGMHLQEYAVW